MLTNSPTECAWTCVGIGLSTLLIGITGACNQCAPFYCSALVQAINNIVVYAGVRKETHTKGAFFLSITLRALSVVAIGFCVAYLYVSASNPPEGSQGYYLYMWLESFGKGCIWTTLMLLTPAIESFIEGIIYIFGPDAEQ